MTTRTLSDTLPDNFGTWGPHTIYDGPNLEQLQLSMRVFPRGQRLNVYLNVSWNSPGLIESNIPVRILGLLIRPESEGYKQGFMRFEGDILEPHPKAGKKIVGIINPVHPRIGQFDFV